MIETKTTTQDIGKIIGNLATISNNVQFFYKHSNKFINKWQYYHVDNWHHAN
jgi:hypothetical protein